MNENKHTPGPWHVEPSPDRVHFDIRGDGVHAPLTDANARLIAAAPELLAALIKAASVFEDLRHCRLTAGDRAVLGSEPVMSAQDACYAAITKAEEG